LLRRKKVTIVADREREWDSLRGEGHNLFTMCLSCGSMAHCRGKSRETVRCECCFKFGTAGQRLMYDILHAPREHD
jgi:hypothetical protein